MQNISSSKSREMLIEDPVSSIINDLEKDSKFVNDISTLIKEKLTNRNTEDSDAEAILSQ
jgi:hypothetical protein